MTVLKDFFAECLFEVTDNFIDDAANTSVLHIGDDHIEDWKVVKRHLDKHDIAIRPQNMTELYECLGFKDIDIVDINDIDNWGMKGKTYDFIFNCHSADKMFDVIRFFEVVDNIANDNSHMTHIHPYQTYDELGFHCLNPSFYHELSHNMQYDYAFTWIGSLEADHHDNIQIAEHIANERYKKRHYLDLRYQPNEGFDFPSFLAITYYKSKKEDVQEDN